MKTRGKIDFLHKDLKRIYDPINIEQTNDFSKEFIKKLEFGTFDTVPKANLVETMITSESKL